MDIVDFSFTRVVLIGLGATFTFDLWAQFLKRTFQIPPSNICLVGRWLASMPHGVFRHVNIASSPHKKGECMLGWIAHYLIGIAFALAFVVLVGPAWLQDPKPISALLYGVVTVLAPFFVLQPSFGLGIAASKTPRPAQARIRSIMNHTAFGTGLYGFALFFNWVL